MSWLKSCKVPLVQPRKCGTSIGSPRRNLHLETLEPRFLLAPAVGGDYNYDSSVNAADYTLWRKTSGSGAPASVAADGDGDRLVDAADYGVWKADYGNASPTPNISAFVPPNITVTPTNPVQTVRV